jgi:hypothetical protein
MAEEPEEMAVQDLLLISEALIQWAGPPYETEQSSRKRRAWTLVDEIAAELGMSHKELVREIDPEWSGPD